MSSSNLPSRVRLIGGLHILLLCSIIQFSAGAQTAPEPRAASGFGPAYDALHEVTLSGEIREVVTVRAGGPVGTHLLVSGSSGEIDAAMGTRLDRETTKKLQAGARVQIVGATVSLHGKQYLVARLLTVDGQTIAVRNPEGLPTRRPGPHVPAEGRDGAVAANGGAR